MVLCAPANSEYTMATLLHFCHSAIVQESYTSKIAIVCGLVLDCRGLQLIPVVENRKRRRKPLVIAIQGVCLHIREQVNDCGTGAPIPMLGEEP